MTARLAPIAALVQRIERFSGRPFWFALALLNAITGVAAAVILAPYTWAADVDFLRRGAEGFLQHVAVADFVFTPLCAVIAVPLSRLSPDAAGAVVTALEAALVVAGIVRETRGMARVDRWLVAIAVLTFLPVVNELLLGQVTVLLAAGLYPLVRADGWLRGVPLGIVLATIPKPLLVPVLAWMLLYRRGGLAAAVVVAAALTVVGMLVAGVDSYGWWFAALVHAGEVARRGNVSVWISGVTPAAIAGAGLVLVGLLAAARREVPAFVAALAAGLLLAPYTLAYAATILLLAPVALRGSGTSSVATRPIALVANVACMAGLAGALAGVVLAAAVLAARSPVQSGGASTATPARH